MLQLAELVVGQAVARAGLGLGVEAVRLTGQAGPAADGLGVDVEGPGDGGPGLAVVDQEDGPPPSPFQFSSSSRWSTHITLDAPNRQREHYPRWTQ